MSTLCATCRLNTLHGGLFGWVVSEERRKPNVLRLFNAAWDNDLTGVNGICVVYKCISFSEWVECGGGVEKGVGGSRCVGLPCTVRCTTIQYKRLQWPCLISRANWVFSIMCLEESQTLLAFFYHLFFNLAENMVKLWLFFLSFCRSQSKKKNTPVKLKM